MHPEKTNVHRGEAEVDIGFQGVTYIVYFIQKRDDEET